MATTPGDATSAAPIRADLQAVLDAKAATLDAGRPDAVAKRRKTGHLTARENIDRFLDAGSFLEYGQLSRPARRDMQGAADGFVMGTGTVDGHRVAVAAYDYTVYAGTQSYVNHAKTDRMLRIIRELRLPFVVWAEGGGWRPHENNIAIRDCEETFGLMAQLSGLVPTVAIVSGRCFAGNANIAGLCDTIVATRKAAMGMAGPALVEAGLGIRLTPEELGPADLHERAGTIDVMVDDDDAAIDVAHRYLDYFRGPGPAGEAPDGRLLREVIPENQRRAYDVRKVIDGVADRGSVMELRRGYGKAVVTALMKVEGRPVGVIANQPMIRAGAMDAPACDKVARFIQLCDAHDVPLLFLCDTPGLMVGPEAEASAMIRRSSRIVTATASATVPFMTVVLRKAYGLGYYMMGSMAMNAKLIVAWPTAEFGTMGTEGAVKLSRGAELEQLGSDEERQATEKRLAEEIRKRNSALEVASRYEWDDVIDPADTRSVIARFLVSLPPVPPRTGRKRVIDNW